MKTSWQQQQHTSHIFNSALYINPKYINPKVHIRRINKCFHIILIFQPCHTDAYCTRLVNQFESEKEKKSKTSKTMPIVILEYCRTAPLKLKSDKTPHNSQLSHFQPLI